ncbi:MAG: putative DNA binding domain-containing protein [Candidatus Sumerlaeota bacterium]|nr:putative DNA binding domain-containing protein [Candidatus Sumerlaeota bacterium]
MNKTELGELIQNGENSFVEFKHDAIDARALARELVAFANAFGGRVLLGVEDDGSVSGLTRPNLEEWIMQICRDKIRPEIIPSLEVIHDAAPGKDVAVICVERGWGVHHLWHDQHYTPCIRVGSLCREMSLEERERLYQQRGGFHLEMRPVPGAALEAFDRRRLLDYFTRIRRQPIERSDDEAWTRLLINTELMSADEGPARATVAGLLLFGKNPNRFLPHAGLDAVAYPGTEKDYAARERQAIRGPMVPLFSQMEADARPEIVESGLVEKGMDFVRRNIEVQAELADGARRVERWAYPLEAVREAIVNALVHRDYLLSSTDIELSIYSDRLEIISPGQLANGITPERMKAGCRSARNQLIKDIMRDYGYLEHMGMGIPRKIIRGMREHNDTEPDLIEDSERFILRLWKTKKD